MAKQTVFTAQRSYKLSEELNNQIIDYCKKNKIKANELHRIALTEYLNNHTGERNNSAGVTSNVEIKGLRTQIESLQAINALYKEQLDNANLQNKSLNARIEELIKSNTILSFSKMGVVKGFIHRLTEPKSAKSAVVESEIISNKGE